MRALVLCLLSVFAGCTSGPRFDARGIDTSLTPPTAARNIDAARERRILWGGVILGSANLKEATQIEILGYPLDSSQRPDTDANPTGRFLVIKDGYLETADYASGRLLTVAGTITDTRTGQIGEASYTYPVIQPRDLYLWPAGMRTQESNVHFGFGVNITR